MAAKVSEAVFREASNELVVLAELPLSFTEGIGFKHFCNKVKLYKPHSRRTATRDIVQMYGKMKEEMKNMISSTKQRVSLTTDIWKCETTSASYMVVTCHFVDTNWRLQKLIIGFKYVSDHKDGSYMHMRCDAHIINLVAKEGFADLRENIRAIHNGITYFRASTNRLKDFELKVDRGRLTCGSLPLDVTTRWNSTFLMLSRAIQFRVAFDKMEEEDKLYNDYFLEHENGAKRVGPPTSRDWNVVGKLQNFLVIFYNSTLVVSASTKVNSHECYGEIVTIESNLSKMSTNCDLDLSIQADEMLKKFHKYWDGVKNINKMLVVSSMFDPTKKMNFAKLYYDKLYGEDSPESLAMYDSLNTLLDTLFKEYNGRFSKHSSSSTVPSSQSSQTSSSGQDQVVDIMELVIEDCGYERMKYVYKEMVKEKEINDPRDEMEKYLKEPVKTPKLMLKTEFDLLSWWKVNSGKYPVLSEIAKGLFALQVSSVASESAFSSSGRVLDSSRSCLTHFHIKVLMCTEQWLKSKIQYNEKVITNEEMLTDLEMLGNLQKMFEESSILDD